MAVARSWGALDMMAEPTNHSPHPLHAPDRAYRETNCYTDVLIELLHSRGLEPLAGLGHLVRTDFEGDQFTFFKMPSRDMELLYGIDVHEMQPLGPLPAQIARQLEHGRTMLVEVDSYFLPDTVSTDYRRNHVKTTIAVEGIDRASQTLLYFHNSGLHALSGEDYRGVFGVDGVREEMLPLYLELARFDAGQPLSGKELRGAARQLLAFHLQRRPRANPFEMFGEQLRADIDRLLQEDFQAFHSYAFATVRMAGAAFDLLRSHAEWLLGGDHGQALQSIVEGCQILSFRLARRRRFDCAPAISAMATAWSHAIDELERATS